MYHYSERFLYQSLYHYLYVYTNYNYIIAMYCTYKFTNIPLSNSWHTNTCHTCIYRHAIVTTEDASAT